jgi:hypothetical protein
LSQPAAELAELLGLSEDELCTVLGADPLEVVSDRLDHRPELPILLALAREAAERVGPGLLARWMRSGAGGGGAGGGAAEPGPGGGGAGGPGPGARPLDLLLARDFAGFEARIGELIERGVILRRRWATGRRP